MITKPTTPSTAEPEPDRPLRGRRLSWEEFTRNYPTARKPANDNQCPKTEATNANR